MLLWCFTRDVVEAWRSATCGEMMAEAALSSWKAPGSGDHEKKNAGIMRGMLVDDFCLSLYQTRITVNPAQYT